MEAATTQSRKPGSSSQPGVAFQRETGAGADRANRKVRTALVCPDIVSAPQARVAESRQAEFEGLAGAIGLDIVISDIVKLRDIRPATFVGAGYLEELAERADELEVELVLFDTQLSPTQQRNLERALDAKVLDRTALILEIFGERAATREGVLQVELAHLKYQKGRLVRSWTHLERQRGGGGFLGGPGETQIESDRRQLQERISLLEKRIDKVARTRTLQRKTRDAVPFPIVALVGYTNAGKSSLFNALTGATVMAKDLLFATLDTTVRKATLPHGRDIMLSDTVGFVADLPTDLVAAFRATLEEVVDADVVLHVRDVSNPDHAAQADDVLGVLADLGVKGETTPIIEVWNKIDLLGDPENVATTLNRIVPAGPTEARVAVSAMTGQGIEALLAAIEKCLSKNARTFRIHVPHENGDDIGWIYSHGEVIRHEEPDETGTGYVVRVQPRHNAAFQRRFADRLSAVDPV